jgi:hypothetical protein
VQAGAWNPTQLRLVTHRHIDDAAVGEAVAAFRAVRTELKPPLAAVR